MNTSESEGTCANCGKGEEAGINLKACSACKMVNYCSKECQIAHRSQHKKECKKRAKKLHDEKLFKQPPPLEDCPICMIRLPSLDTGTVHMTCCGKTICAGCEHANRLRITKEEHDVCLFCRTPPATSNEEMFKRYDYRVELNDANGTCDLGYLYYEGQFGLPQNTGKALELWQRAAELGHADAYTNMGRAYEHSLGVEVDMKKAAHYYELGAMKGDSCARNMLAVKEANLGNMDRALKHWMIAVKDGSFKSLSNIKLSFSEGYATENDYAKALQSYQAYLNEIKSDQRDEAAAADDEYKYYDSSV